MIGFLPRPRVAFALVFAALLVALYFSIGEQPNSAQPRPAQPLPKAKFEQFARSDEITNDIRDKSKEIVRVEFRSIADRDKVTKYGRIVEDFGSFVVLAKNKATDLSRSGLQFQKIDTEIRLPGARFDPIESVPADAALPEYDSGENGYYIIQFGGIAKDDWMDSVRDAGVEILQYIPHQAFFVYGNRGQIMKVSQHSRVRWAGRFLPNHKKSPELADFVSKLKSDRAMFDVAVFERADLQEAAAKIERVIRGRVLHRIKLANNYFNVVQIEAAPGDVDEIAKIPEVVRIDQYEKPQAEDERSSQIISGNFSGPTVLNGPGYNPLAQFGVDGTGVTVMVSDDGISIPGNGGLYITSANTVDGPLRGATAGASGGHGHINASIIAGSTPFGTLDGLGYNWGLGVAPKANIVNIPFLKANNTTTHAQAVDDALNTLGPNGARATISNNSWGDGTNGNAYDSLAAQYDGFVRDGSFASTIDPFSIIFSAGNSGPSAGSLTRPKVSKNTIAVANSENVRPEVVAFPVPSPAPAPIGAAADNMEDLRGSSSRGPTADGRIKPDVTAPGTVITGSRAGSCGSVSGCFDANHAYSTGTSHAAPQVAGAAALFTQYWRNGHAGASPSPALIRAAIINTGQEMNGLTTNTATIPNGIEGWGRINMKFMMNTGVPTQYVNEEIVYSNPGVAQGMIGTVADSTKPVRITLVWTDPPATGDPALVNNLDLQVNVNGTFYRGNVFSGGVSVPGGAGDTLNNVENVFLPAGIPAGSFFSVGVTSVTLNGDGVLGNSDLTDQHFALVAYNFRPLTPPTSSAPVDFDGDNKTDVSIFRPAGGEWWMNRSSDNQTPALVFGNLTDKIVPADYTGDGKTDVAFWRPAEGQLYVLRSEDFSFYAFPFGISTDIFVPGDYDGDNKADAAVFRQSASTWYIARSSGGNDIIQFGISTDRPIPSDYDGDGKTDIAIFRPSGGEWWILRSGGGVTALQFGASTDKLVPGDYTGDGKSDIAFWRPSGGDWFVLRSEDSSFFSVPFGTATDMPVPGDYDGDGKFDRAVFRPSSATWYVDRSTAGIMIRNFGLSSDVPLPNVFVR